MVKVDHFDYGSDYCLTVQNLFCSKELSVKDLSIRHEPYTQNDPNKAVLTPIVRKEGQAENPVLPFKHRARRYVLGYTGRSRILHHISVPQTRYL
jgi:hypothetical protein